MKEPPTAPLKPAPIHAIALMLPVLCLVTSFSGPGVSLGDFYKEAIAGAGFTGLLLYWLYDNRRAAQFKLTVSATRLWFAGLFVLATVSGLWAVNPDFFVSKYLLWVTAAAVFLLVLTLPPDERTRIILARSVVFTAACVAIVGLAQALFALDVLAQAKPPAATFTNKNAAAQVLVLIFPLGVFLLLADRDKRLSILYPFILALIVAYIFHTRTRSAWLGIFVQGLLLVPVLIWYARASKQAAPEQTFAWKRILAPGAAAVLLLLLLVNFSATGWTPFFDLLAAQAGSLVEDARSYDRIAAQPVRYAIWEAALIMIGERPFFGSGMGGFFHNLLADTEKYREFVTLRAHNDVLELGVELGVTGWILLAGASVGLLSNLYKLITRGEIRRRLFYLAVAVALGGGAINMQFSFPFQMPVPLVLFAVYAALAVKAGDAHNPKSRTIEWSPGPAFRQVAVALAWFIFAFIFTANLIWLGAMSRMNDNAREVAWENPITDNPFVCHKSLVQILLFFSDAFSLAGKHEMAIETMESLERCVPGTWLYEATRGHNLLQLKRYEQAIEALEPAKLHGPRGVFRHYIAQFTAYTKINDPRGALRVYEELRAHPEQALARRPHTLRKLTWMALTLRKPEQAKEYYHLYRKYYGENPRFEAWAGKLIHAR